MKIIINVLRRLSSHPYHYHLLHRHVHVHRSHYHHYHHYHCNHCNHLIVVVIVIDRFLDPVAAETSSHRKYLFLILYALTFLFSNFGPNTTCFVIPGEVRIYFPSSSSLYLSLYFPSFPSSLYISPLYTCMLFLNSYSRFAYLLSMNLSTYSNMNNTYRNVTLSICRFTQRRCVLPVTASVLPAENWEQQQVWRDVM